MSVRSLDLFTHPNEKQEQQHTEEKKRGRERASNEHLKFWEEKINMEKIHYLGKIRSKHVLSNSNMKIIYIKSYKVETRKKLMQRMSEIGREIVRSRQQ